MGGGAAVTSILCTTITVLAGAVYIEIGRRKSADAARSARKAAAHERRAAELLAANQAPLEIDRGTIATSPLRLVHSIHADHLGEARELLVDAAMLRHPAGGAQ